MNDKTATAAIVLSSLSVILTGTLLIAGVYAAKKIEKEVEATKAKVKTISSLTETFLEDIKKAL